MSIYQGDSYSFALSLTRKDTTVVIITNVQYTPSISPYAVYTFEWISGPYLHLGTSIVIAGLSHATNNGTFVISGLGLENDSLGVPQVNSGTFSVTNTNAITSIQAGTGTVGTTPNITSPPIIQIVQLQGFVPMLGIPANMVALDSSNQVWVYTWSIGAVPAGGYIAIVSYAADGNTFSGILLEKIVVGDKYILGTVALDATVAKASTVALDATVAHATDLVAINPNTSSVVLAIKAKTDNLPPDPSGMTLLQTTIQNISDVHDAALGPQTVDKTQNPAVYTIKGVANNVVAQFHLIDDDSETSRVPF